MTNKQPERSIEDIVEEYKAMCVNDDTCRSGYSLTIDMELLSEKLTQTLKAERQRCEEITSMPAFKHLQDYKQLDEDGVLVEVSRQAIDEIVQALTQPNKPK